MADEKTAVAEPVALPLDELVPEPDKVTPEETTLPLEDEDPEAAFEKLLGEERFQPVWEGRQTKLRDEERQAANTYWQQQFAPALQELRQLADTRNQHFEEAKKGLAAVRSQMGRLRSDGQLSDNTLLELFESHPEWQAALKWLDEDMHKDTTQKSFKQGQDVGLFTGVASALQHFFTHAEPQVRDKYIGQIQSSNPAQLADAFLDEHSKAVHQAGYDEGYKKGLKDSGKASAEVDKEEKRRAGGPSFTGGGAGSKGTYKERLARGEVLSPEEVDAMTREYARS